MEPTTCSLSILTKAVRALIRMLALPNKYLEVTRQYSFSSESIVALGAHPPRLELCHREVVCVRPYPVGGFGTFLIRHLDS
jgi:hypothetical protein